VESENVDLRGGKGVVELISSARQRTTVAFGMVRNSKGKKNGHAVVKNAGHQKSRGEGG